MKPVSVASRISSFTREYSPDIAAQLRAARKHLRAQFPRGFELVFDNYNALVFAISPTERSADAFVSVAAYPRWVTLFFLHGKSLADPKRLLEGEGKQVRGIRLERPSDIAGPGIAALIAQAARAHTAALLAAPRLKTVIKSVSVKQRPRRTA